MRIVRFSAALGAAALMSACATVTRGSNDTWVAETDPRGATVTTSNGFTCTTPCSLRMPRRSEFVATVERAGCETLQASVTHQVSGAGGAGMAGNVLVGGLIGAAVDMGTGAMNDLVPNPLQLDLVCEGDALYGASVRTDAGMSARARGDAGTDASRQEASADAASTSDGVPPAVILTPDEALDETGLEVDEEDAS